MSKYDNLKNINNTDAQDPLSPPNILGDANETGEPRKNLTPNSAFPIIKNKIFEMYKIHRGNEKDK